MLDWLKKLAGGSPSPKDPGDLSAETVDFDGLLAEARKGLKKALPAGLSWFGFETIPTVRWRRAASPWSRR